MSEFNIEVEGGSSVRLPTAGKYCDRDIVVTSTGGDKDYTALNCVTIENNSSVGFRNGICLFTPLEDVTRIEASLRFHLDQGGIWLCTYYHEKYGSVSLPAIDNDSSFDGEAFTNAKMETDENGIKHFSCDVEYHDEVNGGIDDNGKYRNLVCIGSWMDATFSRTVTIYDVKLYNANELICHLKPALSKGNAVGFYDDVNGFFYINRNLTPFIAGEAV